MRMLLAILLVIAIYDGTAIAVELRGDPRGVVTLRRLVSIGLGLAAGAMLIG